MRKCEYSGNVCQAETLLNILNPKNADELVSRYCNAEYQRYPQFRYIEDNGIGNFMDWRSVAKGGSKLLKDFFKILEESMEKERLGGPQ